MANSDAKSRLKPWALAALLLMGGFAVGVVVWQWDFLIAKYLSHQDAIVPYLRAGRVEGPLWCILAQFIQVVIFIIPGEVTQLAAGYVFGAWWGFLWATIGALLGSAFNFYFGRIAGRRALECFVKPQTINKVAHVLESPKGKAALFALFLLPGAPKDAMCYALGLSAMGLTEFLVITGLARSPALLASTLIGSYASNRDYRSMILVGVAAVVAVGACFLFERNRSRRSTPVSNATRKAS